MCIKGRTRCVRPFILNSGNPNIMNNTLTPLLKTIAVTISVFLSIGAFSTAFAHDGVEHTSDTTINNTIEVRASTGNTATSAPKRQEGFSNARETFIKQHEEARASTSIRATTSVRTSITEIRSGLKAERVAIKEERRAALTSLMGNVKTHMEHVIGSLEKIEAKIQTKIEHEEQNGKDMAEAQARVTLAHQGLVKARTSLTAANDAFKTSFDGDISLSLLKNSRESLHETRENIHQAYTALKEAIRIMKGSIEAETATSVTAESN